MKLRVKISAHARTLTPSSERQPGRAGFYR